MKLEELVCSLKVSEQLKDLGVKQLSIYYWKNKYPNTKPYWTVIDYYDSIYSNISAFTVNELLELLPLYLKSEYASYLPEISNLTIVELKNKYVVSYLYTEIKDKNLNNALAKMLIHVIKKKLM